MSSYGIDNRLKFFVRYMLDISDKGTLHRDDFEFVAFKNAVLETKGFFKQDLYNYNVKILDDLYTELERFAEFKRGKAVSNDEFKNALKRYIAGKSHKEMPKGIKIFITVAFNAIDLNGDGLVGIDEYRLNCAGRYSLKSVKEIDDEWVKLVNDADKKAGGINLARFEELYAQFLGNPDENCNGAHLFGPLRAI